ncbi:hypothetical protein A5631_20720 [Mycolicibacter heraklionensis]|nr:hypothetical protein A5631_20720 [Mycolicibacter heraklionensis]
MTPRARIPLLLLLLINAVVSAGVLIMLLTRPSPEPAYTSGQQSAAQSHMCERFDLAARAVHTATNNPDGNVGVARDALTNGAAMLELAAASPALDSGFREAAQALATAYLTQAAMGLTSTPDQYAEALADTAGKTSAMETRCAAT